MTDTSTASIPTPAAVAAPTGLKYFTNSVLQWNDVLLDTAVADSRLAPPQRNQNGPTRTSRAAAIVHAAIFDAVVGLRGGYPPYLVRLPPVPAGAVLRQAVAGAAYATLVRLYPAQKASLMAAASHYFDPASPTPGAAWGLEIGRRVFVARSTDGSAGTGTYDEPALPGIWRADPLDPTQTPLDPHWGQVRPFSVTASELGAIVGALPKPPGFVAQHQAYNLKNPAYRRALATVRAVGSVQASPPGALSTLNAIFWSYDEGRGTPVRLYNYAARAVALRQPGRLSVLEWARMLFLVNLAMADAAIATWAVKYRYDLWRPITAIREDPIARDPDWTPLGKQLPYARVEHCSPAFPAYVSGHAAIGEAAFHTLALFFGGDLQAFELASDELPREARTFRSLDAASRANANSRVQLGVHFPFDGTRGRTLGRQVADLAFAELGGGSPRRIEIPGLQIAPVEAAADGSDE
ncbi:MAG TPA: phosphatase PAP2 family protein [Longimicrobium sp.]|nr:phosphatase PAP2 family protein [Longimicrobium sp.]